MIFALSAKAVGKVGIFIVIFEIIISALLGLVIALNLAFFLWYVKKTTFRQQNDAQMINQLESSRQTLLIELSHSQAKLESLEQSYIKRLQDMQQNCEIRLQEEKIHSQEMLLAFQEQHTKTQEEQNQNKEELKNAFKALSDDILKQNTQSFTQSQTLSLQPLKDEIARFQKQIAQNHIDAIERNTQLHSQIENLCKLNVQLSNDANNLANALKGENKTQGNWGEIILQRVLEQSGLQEGREYELQVNIRNDEANLLRPDAIIRLPNNRCVVVDSKTSLIAYEKLCNAQDSEESLHAQKELIASIRAHFTNLSTKNYQQFIQGQKLDFVLMFIPIEGAFLESLRADYTLYERAYQKGVVIVSPTTIMAVLRVIDNLWQMEYRNKNVDKIFEEIKILFTRIQRFEEVLEVLGRNIDTIYKTYGNVMTKYNGQQGIAKKGEQITKLLKGAGIETLEDSENIKSSLMIDQS
ncbi:DNA recombination protein RmuC [Helicobacter sp. MIT 05-5293]|uniref:DNA recombination protein RmuC n=1 Tax=Helicobacter sp. MIT 05-5293 TaxID=1548149 RepID=UPI001F540991|nr:DNA recombination protein RmuC [Helicobacter sp. MIT 05-5293]